MNLRARYLNKTFTGVPFSLLNTTILAGGFDPYKVGVYSPDLVFDFENEFYRTNNRKTTFTNAITHTRASNATMVDSDGLIKWAPHNLLTYSEEFDNAAWAGTSGGAGSVPAVTVNTATAPDGSATADKIVFETGDTASGSLSLIAQTTSSTDGVKHTGGLWLKGELGGEELVFRHAGNATFQKLTLTSNWVFYSQDEIAVTASPALAFGVRQQVSGLGILNTSATVYAWGAHFYRSDLGGMVSNPDTGNSYVPTTSSAVYLPRRGHHRYDGSSYVNKGLLHESEARTNLDPNSDDLSAWTTSNTTIAKDQTGAGGNANEAHSITATANNGTALEQITASSADHVWSCLMKRVTGTGTVEVTVDGGSTWVDVTSDINDSAFIQVGTGAGITVTDPQFGVRLGTSGDVVAVQNSQLEQTSGQFSSPIPTSGSTVTRAAETLTIPASLLPYDSTAMSIAMQGALDYADEDTAATVEFFDWGTPPERIRTYLATSSSNLGRVNFYQQGDASTIDTVLDAFPGAYSPGINVPFSIASRHGSKFLNGAVDGTALTENTTPTALPDLSARDLELGYTFMGTIKTFRMWDVDLGDSGIEEASS